MTSQAATDLEDDMSSSSTAMASSQGAPYSSYIMAVVLVPIAAFSVWMACELHGHYRRTRQIAEGRQTKRQAIREKLTLKVLPESSLNLESLECAICLENMNESQLVSESFHCSHRFHAACAEEWFLKNVHCPVCRVVYITSDEATIKRGGRQSSEQQ